MDYRANPQNVIWFRDRYLADELVLKPPFQRQPVWSSKQKHTLIESILMGMPIPEIFVQHAILRNGGAEKSSYAVVDGQQRIRSVLQFIGVDRAPTEQEFNKFALDKLPKDSLYYATTFTELSTPQRDQFLSYEFAVRHLRTGDNDAVRDVFKRINKFVTKLNDQELRNATFSGPFMQLAARFADNEFWVLNGLVKPAQIRRMKDVEFVSELLIGVLHGPQGGNAKSVDEYFTRYEDFDDEFPNQKLCEKRFESTQSVVRTVLESNELERFRSNRTDFYTLFLCITFLLTERELSKSETIKLRSTLHRFEREVDERLADESKKVSPQAIQYVRAAEKGANDKKRRADRHIALTAVIEKHFKKRAQAKT